MKKLLGWIVLLVGIFCLVQFLRAVATATGFSTYLQDASNRLIYENPVMVEESILLRAEEAGVYLSSDSLQVTMASGGGGGSVYAAYLVPVKVPFVEWYLHRTFSSEQ